METFESLSPKEITDNIVRLIGFDWMLVTAGKPGHYNMMTASWGGMGYLWNKPVVFVFVRPQRYTFEFMEERDTFTLSFFSETYREALNVCGTFSGREVDKTAKSGLTPMETEAGNITFEEARLVLECRKLYGEFLRPEAFTDAETAVKYYPGKDFHKVYVAEIVGVWKKK